MTSERIKRILDAHSIRYQEGGTMNINIDKLIESCDTLERRTIYAEGCMHTSSRCFDTCMRAFDNKALPANSITFKVFINAPVMKYGEATVYRDGRLEMRTT